MRMPSIVCKRPAAISATAVTSPGGLGDATATSFCVVSIRNARCASTSASGVADMDIVLSATGKAGFPDTDRHRERPTDEEIDHRDEGKDFQWPEGGRGQFH